MKKVLIAVLVVLLSITLISCGHNESPQTDSNGLEEPGNGLETTESDGKDIEDVEDEEIENEILLSKEPSIAGICLGDSFEKVVDILGTDYEEVYYNEDTYYYGEPTYLREYGNGEISLVVGDESEAVLEIDVTSDKYETWLGDKVGITADEVLPKYRKHFTEPKSIHTDEKLEGWFDVNDGTLIIFDFDKDDGMIINVDITPDSKVELIKLTNMMYID